jgi:hypothetical protein
MRRRFRPKRGRAPNVDPDMITLFIIALAGTGITFAALPVVAFALMLETCAQRTAENERREMETVWPPRGVLAGSRLALAA